MQTIKITGENILNKLSEAGNYLTYSRNYLTNAYGLTREINSCVASNSRRPELKGAVLLAESKARNISLAEEFSKEIFILDFKSLNDIANSIEDDINSYCEKPVSEHSEGIPSSGFSRENLSVSSSNQAACKLSSALEDYKLFLKGMAYKAEFPGCSFKDLSQTVGSFFDPKYADSYIVMMLSLIAKLPQIDASNQDQKRKDRLYEVAINYFTFVKFNIFARTAMNIVHFALFYYFTTKFLLMSFVVASIASYATAHKEEDYKAAKEYVMNRLLPLMYVASILMTVASIYFGSEEK